jgi:hypothetical protein
MDIAAATKILDALRPKSEGEPVNTHVVPQQTQPEPDFEAMRRLIAGNYDRERPEIPARKVSKDDRTT